MFNPNLVGEVTQVDFWTLYRDVFAEHSELYPVLVAAEVIKNVTIVFPEAQAMVLPGTPPKFIVRGVERKQDDAGFQKFQCCWDRKSCEALPSTGPTDLYDHVLWHLTQDSVNGAACLWGDCTYVPKTPAELRAHIRTHIPHTQSPALHPSQDDQITLSFEQAATSIKYPTTRVPPPPRNSTLKYSAPIADPPTAALTALLCIRILFRISFVDVGDAAPKSDADHFGFPGLVDETGDDFDTNREDAEQEGERRGRKAFIGVRHTLSEVRIKDDVLMNWIMEMLDASLSWEESK
jgi:chromatin structure-remodeling complex subunit RSC9